MSELNEALVQQKELLPASSEKMKNKKDNFWKRQGKLKKRFIVLGILLIIVLIFAFLTVQRMLKPPVYNTAFVQKSKIEKT